MTHRGNATVAEPLFISQAKLESWVEQGKVTFEDGVLTLLAEKASYVMAPAVRVLALVAGQDATGLVGQTRTLASLTALGAEAYSGSLLLGETAYQCEEGFVSTEAPAAAPAPPSAPAAAAPAAPAAPATTSDADLLTDFLLKHL
jgi:hypothetical protein